ncbi:MAG: CRISPR-associated helicase/endonuclease Cas3 [Spirochaetes bacterium]|nr:MAG: CRISPR-associated helicase/endonuclease Cas3 [Spirochaetota bacterium]
MIAHVREDDSTGWHIHSLYEHLNGVADLAECFASRFNSSDWARSSALLHDLGKGSNEFQKYITFYSGYNPEAHIEDVSGRVIHSTHGAAWSYRHWGNQIGKIVAYLIAGHHGGLPDWHHEIGVGGSLEYRLTENEIEKLPVLPGKIKHEITDNVIRPSSAPGVPVEQLHLWVRMLFSCLVDADFLDTERFMDRDKFENRGKHNSITNLKELFDVHMNTLVSRSDPTSVNEVRQQVLSQCRKQAGQEEGLFTLTVPTGGGKTLSSMAFALEHAMTHKKERIIVVIPYTSIIEQTSGIYKEIFGDGNVIEHHSSLDPVKESFQSRLASENWDAPIIVTTSVQFFESLFSARSSSCRKLHNIVNSVVVIDEVQMLPTNYLLPILQIIKGLTKHFGVSMVLMSATQPAITEELFEKSNGEHYSILEKEQCREIMVSPNPGELAEAVKRVEIIQKEKYSEWSTLAEEAGQFDQVLCIVNTRKDCRDLYKRMPEGTVHLSANMCGEHRSRVIARIKERLRNNDTVRVVSTQLVEAGVDIDFPVVYRAMAGLDSIAQAAGRCNREGKMAIRGQVFVFEPPKQAPAGSLRKGAQSGREILSVDPDGCRELRPGTLSRYFKLFYSSVNSFDRKGINDLLVKDCNPHLNFQFKTAAQRFQIIENHNQISIVVWYNGGETDSRDLIKTLRYAGPSRLLMRKLQRFTISIPERIFLEVSGSFEEIQGIWCQNADTLYDDLLGFVGYEGDFPVCI